MLTGLFIFNPRDILHRILYLIMLFAFIINTLISGSPIVWASDNNLALNCQTQPQSKVTNGNIKVSSNDESWICYTGKSIQIDLGTLVDFKAVRVYEFKEQRCTGYLLERSDDGVVWEKISEKTGEKVCPNEAKYNFGSGYKYYYGDIKFDAVQAKYIKLTITSLSGNAVLAYISEVEVYNSDIINSNVPDNSNDKVIENEDVPVKNTNNIISDIQNDNKVVYDLVGLNILKCFPDGTFRPDDNITKAEFAEILINMLNAKNIAESCKNEVIFSDVPIEHSAIGYINALYKMGIIKKNNEMKFHPDEKTSYIQAVRALICALGYEPVAEESGGCPDGCLTTAYKIGLTNNVSSVNNAEPIKRSMFAQLIYNALDIDIMEIAMSQGKKVYSTKKDKTILSSFWKAVKGKGVLINTKESLSDGTSGINKNEVIIDNNIYNIGTTNACDYLGQYVIFYYEEDTNNIDNVLLTIRSNPSRNTKQKILAEDIVKTTVDVIKYRTDSSNRVLEYDLSNSAIVYYNGKKQNSYTEETLCPLTGYIELIDNNNDEIYDVVFVNEYIDIIVDTVNLSEGKIVDKYNDDFNLVLEPNNNYDIIKNGEYIGLEDLKEYDVISVMADKMKKINGSKIVDTVNSTLYKLIVSDVKVEGEIGEITEKGVVINNKEYQYAKKYTDYSAALPIIGDTGVFYVNIDGKIAAVNINKSSGKTMGILIDVSENKDVSKTIEILIYTEEGERVCLAFDDKISINNDKREKTTLNCLMNNGLISLLPEITAIKQLVVIEKSKEDKIIKIHTGISAQQNINDNAVLEKSVERLPVDNEKRALRRYKYNSKKFFASTVANVDYPEFCIDKDTKVFIVSGEDITKEFEEDFYDIDDYLCFKDAMRCDVEAYNLSDVGIAQVLVYYKHLDSSQQLLDHRDNLLLIEKVTDTINENDETIKKIYGYYQGKEVFYTFANELKTKIAEIEMLCSGDLIEIKANENNEIVCFEKHFSIKQPKMKDAANNDAFIQIVFGKVCERKDDYILFGLYNDDWNSIIDKKTFLINNKAYFYSYNINKKKAQLETGDIIQKGNDNSILLIRFYDGWARELVLYNFTN